MTKSEEEFTKYYVTSVDSDPFFRENLKRRVSKAKTEDEVQAILSEEIDDLWDRNYKAPTRLQKKSSITKHEKTTKANFDKAFKSEFIGKTQNRETKTKTVYEGTLTPEQILEGKPSTIGESQVTYTTFAGNWKTDVIDDRLDGGTGQKINLANYGGAIVGNRLRRLLAKSEETGRKTSIDFEKYDEEEGADPLVSLKKRLEGESTRGKVKPIRAEVKTLVERARRTKSGDDLIYMREQLRSFLDEYQKENYSEGFKLSPSKAAQVLESYAIVNAELNRKEKGKPVYVLPARGNRNKTLAEKRALGDILEIPGFRNLNEDDLDEEIMETMSTKHRSKTTKWLKDRGDKKKFEEKFAVVLASTGVPKSVFNANLERRGIVDPRQKRNEVERLYETYTDYIKTPKKNFSEVYIEENLLPSDIAGLKELYRLNKFKSVTAPGVVNEEEINNMIRNKKAQFASQGIPLTDAGASRLVARDLLPKEVLAFSREEKKTVRGKEVTEEVYEPVPVTFKVKSDELKRPLGGVPSSIQLKKLIGLGRSTAKKLYPDSDISAVYPTREKEDDKGNIITRTKTDSKGRKKKVPVITQTMDPEVKAALAEEAEQREKLEERPIRETNLVLGNLLFDDIIKETRIARKKTKAERKLDKGDFLLVGGEEPLFADEKLTQKQTMTAAKALFQFDDNDSGGFLSREDLFETELTPETSKPLVDPKITPADKRRQTLKTKRGIREATINPKKIKKTLNKVPKSDNIITL